MPILHYGAEIWGHENAAQLESVQLGYFKRLYGLHRMTHTQFLKGDLGLWSLKSYRTVQMIKFWLRVVQLPSDRLLKAAYDELLQLHRKRSWPFKVKEVLDKTGFSFAWNDGLGPTSQQLQLDKEIKRVLEDQTIQKWGEEIKNLETLRYYKEVNIIYGQEFYFKLNLPSRYLTYWMQLRSNCLPIRSRLKVFERRKSVPDGRFACPLCQEEEENLEHCLSRCRGLLGVRENLFGNDGVLLPDALKSTSSQFICLVGRYLDEYFAKRRE